MRVEDLSSGLNDDHVFHQLVRKNPAFFLDYDGTLTPIVSHPEDAVLSESMRSVVMELATLCSVAVVSGRDRAEVQKLVGLDELIYAGSHGFDISGPGGMHMQHNEALAFLPALDKAQKLLVDRLSRIPGGQVERKKFSIAVHYRNVAQEVVPDIEHLVDEVHGRYPELRKGAGKKVIELQPDIEWNKGKAVLWLLDHAPFNEDAILPVYIGDDLTDEDAFAAIRNSGVGILVGAHGHETKARYSLRDVPQVEAFLRNAIVVMKGRGT
jgi:trehalose 6-phosphate phosphatase